MLRANYEFDLRALELAERRVVESPKLMQRALKRAQGRLRSRVLKIVAVEPGKPNYPLRWASAKQRRYVMAKLRAENNIPYQRTHEFVKAWDAKFKFDADGGAFEVENKSPIARYVVGEDQQPFHSDTGWLNAEEVINDYAQIVMDVYAETWLSIADPFV